ncbi:MAG: beta-lactamase family protein [Ignavibacteria bacterium]|nr:beta-lactamase family protein [Ignavibacteria bacterium]
MKTSLKVILFLLVLLSGKAQSQFNEDSLSAFIGRKVRAYVDTNKACIVTGVIRKEGGIEFTKRYSFGHIRHDTASPRPDSLTIFHIGSTTKTYTATILSMLIQQGGPLALNELVQSHLPLNIVKAPFYVSPQGDTVRMTILDLASHYSALPDDPISPVNDSTSYQMMYNYLNNHRLSREPGKCYLYSNLGISLLGVVLSHTENKSIDSLFIVKLSDPLGMPDTRISLNPEQLSRRATGYLPNGDSAGYFKNSWPAFYAAGGIYTTITDFMKYLQFNMGLGIPGYESVLDSAHKMRRINNDTCHFPDSKAKIGLVWQMQLLKPQTDTSLYFIWKDGDVPGFSSYICFVYDKQNNLKTGVAMISNINIPVDRMAVDILKYLNNDSVKSGIKQISFNNPSKIRLYQNYPNPFNPSTIIKFDIPSDEKNRMQKVNLTVYDGLGKNVSELVNENLEYGTYEIEFKGEDLPSSVYYYKLTCGKYGITGKMLLLK